MKLKHALPLLTALILLPAPAAAQPAAERWKTVQVPTGGFAIRIPSSWIHATSGQPQAFARLNAAFRRTPTSDSRLVAVAASQKGLAYMEVIVERPGQGATLQALARSAVSDLKASVTLSGAPRLTAVTLPAGKAMVLRATVKPGAHPRLVSYLLYRDGLAYTLSYVTTRGAKDNAIFERSARSFNLVEPENLNGRVLRGAQVGRGYKLQHVDGGDSAIGEVTLDVCGQAYPSEALRTARLQVAYKAPNGRPPLSNEVVTYVRGGARQALQEVNRVVTACAKKPIVRGSGATKVTFRAHRFTSDNLSADMVAFTYDVTVVNGKQKNRLEGVAIYQVFGDTLSGVYAYATGGATEREAVGVAIHAAAASAKRLRPSKLTA